MRNFTRWLGSFGARGAARNAGSMVEERARLLAEVDASLAALQAAGLERRLRPERAA